MLSVIRAKAGISDHKVTAGLPEAPAFAGVTRVEFGATACRGRQKSGLS